MYYLSLTNMKRSLIIFALLLFAITANAQSYSSPGIPAGTTSLTPTFRTKAATPDSLAQIWLAIGGNKFYRMLSGMDVIVFDARVVQGLGTTSSKLTFRDTLLKPNWIINPADTLHPALTVISDKAQAGLLIKPNESTDGRAVVQMRSAKNNQWWEVGANPAGQNKSFGIRRMNGVALPAVDYLWYVEPFTDTSVFPHQVRFTNTRAYTPGDSVAYLKNGFLEIGPAPSGGGTTTNQFTAATSGGASPGTTFDGSVARTFDYSSFGAAPAFTATGSGVILSSGNLGLGGSTTSSRTINFNTHFLEFTGTDFGGTTGTTIFQGNGFSSNITNAGGDHYGINISTAQAQLNGNNGSGNVASVNASSNHADLIFTDGSGINSVSSTDNGIHIGSTIDFKAAYYDDVYLLPTGNYIPSKRQVDSIAKAKIDSAISGTTIHTSKGLSGDGSVGTPVVLGGTFSGNIDEDVGANSIDWHGDNGTYAVDNLIDNTPGGSLISSQASNSAGSHYAAVNIGITSPTGWYAELATNKSGSGASIQLDGNTGNTTITNTLGSFGAQYGADYSTALRLNPNGIASVKVVKDMADSVKGTISAGASPGNPSGLLTFTASNGSNATYLRNDGLHAIDSTVVRSVANSYSLSGMQTKLNNYALTSALPVGANPTGTAGTSAVNGSATTFMRSDAAPKVDSAVFQTILNYFPKGDTRYLQKAATTLPSSFVNSSLTSVGTLGGLTVTAAPTFSAMTSGSVLFAGTSGLLSQNNANFFWDNTNKFLGVGTNSPADFLHVNAGTTSGGLTVEETNSGTHSPWVSVKKGTNQVFWSLAGATDSFFLGTSAGDMIFRATTGKNIWFGASDGSTAASLEIVSGGEIKAVAGDVNIATAGKRLKVAEGTNGFAGQTTLVSGTKAITITGVTTSSRAFCQLVTQGGTVTTTQVYGAVCTANTLTITALTTAGATDTTDTSLINYFVVN